MSLRPITVKIFCRKSIVPLTLRPACHRKDRPQGIQPMENLKWPSSRVRSRLQKSLKALFQLVRDHSMLVRAYQQQLSATENISIFSPSVSVNLTK